jgi:Ni/Co efflux regulator RcnB
MRCWPRRGEKRWAVGRPLRARRSVPPPPGYRYARVANDVLLLAIGTGMVVDAITDLGRM